MNDYAYIKPFQMIKFISENCNDDYLISKISILLRRDKIEAPYFMITKIKLSSCIDNPDNGVIHAMDVVNHNRMYNLTEDKYNQIKSLIEDTFDKDYDSNQVKISNNEKQLKMVLMSKNENELANLFNDYCELFDKIDELIG